MQDTHKQLFQLIINLSYPFKIGAQFIQLTSQGSQLSTHHHHSNNTQQCISSSTKPIHSQKFISMKIGIEQDII